MHRVTHFTASSFSFMPDGPIDGGNKKTVYVPPGFLVGTTGGAGQRDFLGDPANSHVVHIVVEIKMMR